VQRVREFAVAMSIITKAAYTEVLKCLRAQQRSPLVLPVRLIVLAEDCHYDNEEASAESSLVAHRSRLSFREKNFENAIRVSRESEV